jgi:nicotinamidase-related amidase
VAIYIPPTPKIQKYDSRFIIHDSLFCYNLHMAHKKILDVNHSAFVIIDVQEGFRSIIPNFAEIAANIERFLQGAKILDVPVIVTEQYPKGLGRTAEEILFALDPEHAPLEKTAFSSCGATGFVSSLKELGIQQVILGGIEAHICVSQTAHDLLDAGFQVHLLTDCISSRFEINRKAGLDKMMQSGAIPSTVEMALFELMRDAKHEQFKAIQHLVK